MTAFDAPPPSSPLPAGAKGPVELIARLIHEFVATMDLDATLRRAVALVVEYVGAEAGSLFLLDETGRELTCHACCGPTNITGTRIPSGEGIVGRAVRSGTIQLVRDVDGDPSFSVLVDTRTGFRTRSILCAPLRVHEERLGAIELLNKRGGDGLFSEADSLALEVLAGSAALALVNARQAARLLEQERLRRELELAAEIQRSLLPAERKAQFPVHGINLPARGVSGDFFDFLVRADGSVVFCLGDVSGKGMNAALLMAKTSGLHRCLARERRRPGELLWILNREVCETSVRGMFVTMVSGVYDPATGLVRLANAGHEPPLLAAADGSFTPFPAEAPPLGIIAGASEADFPETELSLDGGALYVVSDGVTEGRLPSGEQLGQAGLVRLLGAQAGRAATARLDAVVRAFAPGELHDDVTLLVIDDTRDDRAATVGSADAAPTAPEALVELRVPARTQSLKIVRDAVSEAACRAGCSARSAADVSLAVDEACQNVIRHAYAGAPGEIVVAVERQAEDLVVHIRDFAPEIDPTQVKPRDLDDVRPGGLGTHFIREIMDAADFLRPVSGTGNVLRLRKRIE